MRELIGLSCLLLAFSASSKADAEARLDVSGQVLATEPGLRVQVVVANRGDRATNAVEVAGEWQQQQRSARLPAGLEPGASGSVVLEFDEARAVAGVHVLPLLLEHPLEGARDAAGNPPIASERAWLLVAVGEPLPPAVELQAAPLELTVRGDLLVRLSSRDAQAHQVELRALPARGLRAENEAPARVTVAGSGTTTARVPLVRSGAPRGSNHGVLLVAESRDPGPLRTSVAVAEVRVAELDGLFPRLRAPLAALAALLLVVALGVEAWQAFRRRPAPGPPAA